MYRRVARWVPGIPTAVAAWTGAALAVATAATVLTGVVCPFGMISVI